MSPSQVQTLQTAAVAGVIALIAVAGLAALAKPAGFEARREAVMATAEDAARTMGRRAPAPLPAGAVCDGGEAASADLQGKLAQAARAAQLTDVQVTVTAQPAETATPRMRALAVTLEGVGAYEAALAAVQQLGGVRPLVFIDSVDLVSKTSSVGLSVSGRAFCSVQ